MSSEEPAESGDSAGDEASFDASEPPEIADHEGNWDEYLAGAIVASPIVLGAVGLVAGVATGHIQVGTVTLGGTVSVPLLVYGGGVLLGATYVLSLAKLFGVKPVAWLASTADSYRRD